MTERLTRLRRRADAGRDAIVGQDDRSMRLLELGLAFTAIAVVIVLAIARP